LKKKEKREREAGVYNLYETQKGRRRKKKGGKKKEKKKGEQMGLTLPPSDYPFPPHDLTAADQGGGKKTRQEGRGGGKREEKTSYTKCNFAPSTTSNCRSYLR